MANIDDTKHLLVSDSNEISQQMDSKRLSISDLAEMMQNDLFKKHLNIMGRYLPRTQYEIRSGLISDRLDIAQKIYQAALPLQWNGKFKVVDGQVILLDVESFKKMNYNGSPLQWVQENWDIGMEFQVNQIQDCMLRGVVEIDPESPDAVKRASNTQVGLAEENMPPHMHHSVLTSGASLNRLTKGEGESDKVSRPEGGLRYDLFCNDSISTGLDENELQGTSENFKVQEAGSSSPAHPNLPPLRRYYAFAVTKTI